MGGGGGGGGDEACEGEIVGWGWGAKTRNWVGGGALGVEEGAGAYGLTDKRNYNCVRTPYLQNHWNTEYFFFFFFFFKIRNIFFSFLYERPKE